MYLAWVYFGSQGFQSRVERAFEHARQLFRLLEECEEVVLVTRWPVPCLQVSPNSTVPQDALSA